MTRLELRAILEQTIAEHNDSKGKGGAAAVAKKLNISDSQMSQYRKGTYAAPDAIERRIREVLGGETVACPELGEITLGECSGYRKRQPATDSFYARMYRACKQCKRRK
jgi:DNA-binding transcriptional regulator YdaS (Cro superfamily)